MPRKYTNKDTMYACFAGYTVQAVLANLAPLFFVTFQDLFSVSLEQIGRLVLLNFFTQMLTDLASVRFAVRLGYRRGMVLAHLFAAAGLVMMGALPQVFFSLGGASAAYAGLMLATVTYAIGGGLIEVLVSPLIEALPSDEGLSGGTKSAAMSLLHSFYCWGQLAVCLITTLLLRIVGAGIWWVLPFAWAALPVVNLAYVLRVPMPPMQQGDAGSGGLPLRELFSNGAFWIAMTLMLSAGASELAMSQWASLFAERALGVSKMAGDLLGPGLFAVFMGLGRTMYARAGDRLDLSRVLLLCAALCLACYSLTVFVRLPVFSFLGCAVCGLSVSLMWPGTLSLTARSFPQGGAPMFGVLAMCGDIGCSLGPWLTGIVSDKVSRMYAGGAGGFTPEQLGLKAGLGAAMIFPLLMGAGVIALRSRERRQSGK